MTVSSIDIVVRLLVAVTIGGVIGFNRHQVGKPAGLRTHMLVALGAALMVLIPLQIGASPSPDAISRTVQGVATGIGFLGAGEILQSVNTAKDLQTENQSQRLTQPTIQGLTSAASIWTTAALGLATGCGLWVTSLVGILFVWFILMTAAQIEKVKK